MKPRRVTASPLSLKADYDGPIESFGTISDGRCDFFTDKSKFGDSRVPLECAATHIFVGYETRHA